MLQNRQAKEKNECQNLGFTVAHPVVDNSYR